MKKLSLTILALLATQLAFAGRPACHNKIANAPLQSVVATGSGRLLLEVGNFNEGTVIFFVAPAESSELEYFAGKQILYPQAIAKYQAAQNAGLMASNPDRRAQILSVGKSVIDGNERYLAPGRSYKVMVATLVKAGCPLSIDKNVITVKMPEDSTPVAPEIKFRRIGSGDIEYSVTAPSGIRSTKIRIDGIEQASRITYGGGESIFHTLPDTGLYRRELIPVYDLTQPREIEIEAEAMDGARKVHKLSLPLQ